MLTVSVAELIRSGVSQHRVASSSPDAAQQTGQCASSPVAAQQTGQSTPSRTGGASKTATGMAHFSIMWQGPPTMADEAFPGG